LYRVEGKPAASASNFSDVDRNAYYAQAVAWSSDKGIVSGIGNNCFSPDSSITREQLATIIYQYAKNKGLDVSKTGDLSQFRDSSSTSNWAKQAMEYVVGVGIISGRDNGKLDPKGKATRAEVARILQVFLEQIAE
jgi:S-layer homology domain.